MAAVSVSSVTPGASAAAVMDASSSAAPEEGGAPARVPQAASATQQKTAIYMIFTLKTFYKKNRAPVHIKGAGRQGIGIYFHVPRNHQVLEEFLTARSKKSKKFLLSSPFFFFLFRLIRLRGKFFLQSLLF
jgi:hypothetical protein